MPPEPMRFWYSEQASRQTHFPGMAPMTGKVRNPEGDMVPFNLYHATKDNHDPFKEYKDKVFIGWCDPDSIEHDD